MTTNAMTGEVLGYCALARERYLRGRVAQLRAALRETIFDAAESPTAHRERRVVELAVELAETVSLLVLGEEITE
jgi:hypothetical protein